MADAMKCPVLWDMMHVIRRKPDVSEEYIVSIFRVMRKSNEKPTKASLIFHARLTQLSACFYLLFENEMEAVCPSRNVGVYPNYN
jgi:hypothetical protein